jgi:hypothetical protein
MIVNYNRKEFIVQAIGKAFFRVVNYAPRVTPQIVASHTYNTRGIIYSHNLFIVQATGIDGNDVYQKLIRHLFS